MRKKIAAGNWKMNTTPKEGKILASEVIQMTTSELSSDAEVVLIPPYTHLGLVKGLIGTSERIRLGAQNCSEHHAGAYTGEISVKMLVEIGVHYVVIGHSERREYFGETDEQLARKVDKVLEGHLSPIFCCGESLDIREQGNHESFVSQQIEVSLFHLSADQLKKVVIAYEPIWAIGTGKTASAEQAQAMHKALRNKLAGKYGEDIAGEISILYGGSVKANNAEEIFSQPDVDGGLVGGASLKSRDFTDIARAL